MEINQDYELVEFYCTVLLSGVWTEVCCTVLLSGVWTEVCCTVLLSGVWTEDPRRFFTNPAQVTSYYHWPSPHCFSSDVIFLDNPHSVYSATETPRIRRPFNTQPSLNTLQLIRVVLHDPQRVRMLTQYCRHAFTSRYQPSAWYVHRLCVVCAGKCNSHT